MLDLAVITTICTSKGRFWWKLDFSQRNYFSCHFRTFIDVHQPSGKFIWQGCQKCSLRVHRNILRRSLSLGNLFFTTFITYSPRIFRPTADLFPNVLLKLHSACIDECFEWEKMKSVYFFNFFGLWAVFFRVFFRNFVNGVVKTELCIPMGTFCGKTIFSWKNYNFMSLSHIERKKIGFCRNCSGLNVKFAFYLSIEIFWGERSLLENSFFKLSPSDFERTFFVSLLKNC